MITLAMRYKGLWIAVMGAAFAVSLVVAAWPRADTERLSSQSEQSITQQQKAQANPNAFDHYAIAKSTTDPLGTEDQGLSPDTKKRLREMIALQMAGMFQKQNNPIRVDVVGNDHDVFVFYLPSNLDPKDVLREFRTGNANFWNGMRLTNYAQVVFSGHTSKRVVSRKEFLGYCKDYDKYKATFLRATRDLQAGAKGELGKP
jgi:hypothetical protein